jgi:IS605 OrfB family transposase
VKAPAPKGTRALGVLGVDLGRRRVAVDSAGNTYEGEAVQSLRTHYLKVRRSIQPKGTRGARRLLKRLSGRERRHMQTINHVISKTLVETARTQGKALALEDLTGIRERTKVRKTHQAQHHAWAFSQLRQFVQYKAQDAGIALVVIDPRYTSKTCHCCGNRGHRSGLTFVCTRCDRVMDADWNAACNIATAGALVTAPGTPLHRERVKAAGL